MGIAVLRLLLLLLIKMILIKKSNTCVGSIYIHNDINIVSISYIHFAFVYYCRQVYCVLYALQYVGEYGA